MSRSTLRNDEVQLYGIRFPTFGTVRRTAVTPFAPKFVIGDYTRDDQIIASSWILRTFSGGLGIGQAQLPRDSDRFWYSNLETRYRNLTLGALVHRAGSLLGPATLMIEYNTRLYVVVGSQVHRWNESTGLFSLVHTLTSPATASAVYRGNLYILTEQGLHEYNGTTGLWKDFLPPVGGTPPANSFGPGGVALIEWDGKLFRLGNDNKIYWSINVDQNDDGYSVWDPANPGATENDWEPGGVLHLPPGYCRQLLIYFDLSGEPVIHAITRIGVYGYDFAAAKFYETPVTYPATVTAGNGAAVWRGELYVPAGKTIYKYNGSTIQVVSPGKDDGLPASLRGSVVEVIPGHAFYYASITTVDSTAEEIIAGDLPTGNPFDLIVTEDDLPNDPIRSPILGGQESNGAILASPGQAWHGLYDELVGTTMGASLVASIENTFRLWISTGSGIYYIDLDTGLHNPLQNPITEYRQSGLLETGWTDLGWSEVDKLALSLDIVGSNLTASNTIKVLIAWDGKEQWEEIGTADTDGHTEFAIGDAAGRVFRSVKIRIELTRDPDTTRTTPVLEQIVFGFMRRPPMLWGWEVNLLLTKKLHAGKTHNDLVDELYRITEEEKRAGEFIYRDRRSGREKIHRVVVSRIAGAEEAGDDGRGRYTVSLLQLDTPDELTYQLEHNG